MPEQADPSDTDPELCRREIDTEAGEAIYHIPGNGSEWIAVDLFDEVQVRM